MLFSTKRYKDLSNFKGGESKVEDESRNLMPACKEVLKE